MRLLVVGGNGFLGSSICKAALAKGWEVSSISSSGRPFVAPSGRTPAWAKSPQMKWHAANAGAPETWQEIAASSDACVHSVGRLLEGEYKTPKDAAAELVRAWSGGSAGGSNPLKRSKYDAVNRDLAVTVANTFASTRRKGTNESPAPFIFISAADHFRPIIPEGYIRSKREAEAAIAQLAGLRSIFMRPGLMYHPANRPLSTLPAALLDLSAAVHGKAHTLGTWVPTPSRILSFLSSPRSPLSIFTPPSPHEKPSATPSSRTGPDFTALARGITTPPLHVDTVAKAVVRALEESEVEGPIEPADMKRLLGWRDVGAEPEESLRERPSF
ncbi:NAD(P)-binding protein [Ceraceosorus guamensis]|uniref:NAD(P)-binding protein n=1 Tax=Ceraceosorus guamensis TaxID=1522189 RepID=A0A316VY17_9BASI|nr:NAD(P)-binding protein [Ceraceosorus guamensis]PWN41798.1 NAD(P)-binding protein [Ceraceosorus guamensis]